MDPSSSLHSLQIKEYRAGEKVSLRRWANPLEMMANLWGHREVIMQLSRREVSQRYKGTQLGLVWPFLTSLVMLAVYTFIFGFVFQVRWGTTPKGGMGEFAIILYCGLILFTLFSETVTSSIRIVTANPNYVKKVVFPLEILPLATLGGGIIHMVFSLVIFFLGMTVVIGIPGLTVLYFPLVFLPFCAFILGLSWLGAALGVFLRDLYQLAVIAMQILFYVSPVFYSLDAIPERVRWVFYLNPIAVFVNDSRRVLIWHQAPEWLSLGAMTLVSLMVLQFGYMVFMKSRKAFGDVI